MSSANARPVSIAGRRPAQFVGFFQVIPCVLAQRAGDCFEFVGLRDTRGSFFHFSVGGFLVDLCHRVLRLPSTRANFKTAASVARMDEVSGQTYLCGQAGINSALQVAQDTGSSEMKGLERTKPDEDVAERVTGGVHAEQSADNPREPRRSSRTGGTRSQEPSRRRTQR
jgi:hypothetical protein